ncbi:MAG: DUF1326 domain-containing protein [Planctomycetota bacterium]
MIVLVALAALVSEPASPRGWYVEARTAAVFAGACHHGAQSTLVGRDALLTWHVDAGEYAGVDLAGLDVAVLVRGNANLGEPATVRESWIFVEDSASRARASAAAQWLARHHATALGTVRAVRQVSLSTALDGDRYRVSSPGLFELAGSALPDRACCSMPQQVWYRPFAALDAPLVGLDDEFRVTAKELGIEFSRPDENGAILGFFGGGCGSKSIRAPIR